MSKVMMMPVKEVSRVLINVRKRLLKDRHINTLDRQIVKYTIWLVRQNLKLRSRGRKRGIKNV